MNRRSTSNFSPQAAGFASTSMIKIDDQLGVGASSMAMIQATAGPPATALEVMGALSIRA